MTDIDPNEPFAGQLRLMLSMGMTDMTKNRLALARSGGRVQQAIDWIATDTIPETGIDTLSLGEYVAYKANPNGVDPQKKALKELASMGFRDERLNERALFESSNDVDKAVEWIIERTGDKETRELFKSATSPTTQPASLAPAKSSSKLGTSPSKFVGAHGAYPFSGGGPKSYGGSDSPTTSSSPSFTPHSTVNTNDSSTFSRNTAAASSRDLLDDAFTPKPIGSYVPQPPVQRFQPTTHSQTFATSHVPVSNRWAQPAPSLASTIENPFQGVPAAVVKPRAIDENKFLSIEDLKKKGILGDPNAMKPAGWAGQAASALSHVHGHVDYDSPGVSHAAKANDDEEDPFADPFADQ